MQSKHSKQEGWKGHLQICHQAGDGAPQPESKEAGTHAERARAWARAGAPAAEVHAQPRPWTVDACRRTPARRQVLAVSTCRSAPVLKSHML